MHAPDTDETTAATASSLAEADDAELVEEDLLLEEISIDGMCGVY